MLIEREASAFDMPGEIILRPGVPIKPRLAFVVHKSDDGPAVAHHVPRCRHQAPARETVRLAPHGTTEDRGAD